MSVRPRTSVIVLNYNGRRWLARCLEALVAQRGDAEVIVVDNASTDGSIEAARLWPAVRILELPENVGFAAGNNAGARAASASDYLVFLNNDTEVQPGWLAALVDVLDRHPHSALTASHIVSFDDPTIVDSAGDGYLHAGGAYKRWHGEARSPGAGVEEVFGACGAAFAIRRQVFEALDGFDEDFFMVYEDVDLSYRARLAGWTCLYVPTALVKHAGSASLGVGSDAAVFHGQRNLEWVWLKNTPALWRGAMSHMMYSLAGCVYYAARGRGWACVRGKLAAMSNLPSTLLKRRRIQSARTISPAAIRTVMTPRWWRVKRGEKAGFAARGGRP
jgi:GT2 family glycosyltransferase